MLGQDGQSNGGGVLAVAGLLAAVLLGAVGVAAFRADTASADTVLLRGADATLTLTDGSRRPAVEGEQVPNGASVLAGRSGAVLSTVDREVHLYPAASVTVLDGVRQVLAAGSVIVDASDAPGLDLDTPAAVVSARDGSLVRVDSGPLTRVGVLRTEDDDEPGADVRATGRRAATEVAEYYQVQVARGGLPGGTSPLLLTGDDYELALARDLVLSDRMLNQIGRTLVSTGTEGSVVLAALRTAVPDVNLAATSDTERALGYLIATSPRAVSSAGGSEAELVGRVRELRSAGGSWGVVAAIVGSTVDGVGARLAQLLAPAALVLAVEQQPLSAGELFGLDPTQAAAVPAVPGVGSSAGPRPEGGDPGSEPGGEPSPDPVPLPTLPPEVAEPIAPATEVVESVVDIVLDLVDLTSGSSTTTTPSPSSTPLLDPDLPLLP